MKKRGQLKKKDNVIFFPGTEKRLTDKGLESLKNKKFSEAIRLLEEAKELDSENENVLIGLVLAYYEAGSYQKAKALAKELLLKGIGDYFQLVDLYLTVLIQLHEYQEIIATIEVLLDEREVPPERHDHFLTLLQFSRKMAENHQPANEIESEDENMKLNLQSLSTLNEQMLLVSRLAEKNIRPYVPEIEEYLRIEAGHPFLKTILLTLLKEQEINQELVLNKLNMERKVNPVLLPEVRLQPKMLAIKELLEARLESSDPILLENINGMVERTFFISYPFSMEPENPGAWAAGFHFLGQEYLGLMPKMDQLAKDYQVSQEEMDQTIIQITEIEKISYPNL